MKKESFLAMILPFCMQLNAAKYSTQLTDSLILADDDSVAVIDTSEIDKQTIRLNSSEFSYKPKHPEIQFRSPEASAFQKYGEVDVNEYTGTPEINIPLYSLKEKDMIIPITLTYDATGIKVDQESSWVGLGWNLSVGGCINYVCQGDNDNWLGRSGSWEDYYRVLNGNPAECFRKTANFEPVGFSPVPENDNLGSMLGDLKNGAAEFDYYSVNILGKSFLFFKNPYNDSFEVISNEDQKYRIEMFENSYPNSVQWKITDGNGTQYYFSNSEYSYVSSYSYVSAWKLTEIVSPQSQVIDFEYSEPCDVTFFPKLQQYYDHIADSHVISQSSGNQSYATYSNAGLNGVLSGGNWKVNKGYLSAIKTENFNIHFYASGRNDLAGSQKLDSIVVSSRWTGKRLRKYSFNYSYFESCSIGGNYMAFPQKDTYTQEDLAATDNKFKLRLKLTSVDEISGDGRSLTTSFFYHEENLLPLKTSCARDYWGYYNGKENKNHFLSNPNSSLILKNTLVPSPKYCLWGSSSSISADLLSIEGANRFPSQSHCKTGTLRKIIYPTKGCTEFEYELNTFYSNQFIPSGLSSYVVENVYSVNDSNFDYSNPSYVSFPENHKAVTITTESSCRLVVRFNAQDAATLRLMQTKGASVSITPMTPPFEGSQNVTLNSFDVDYTHSYYEGELFFNLVPNQYMMVANLPSEITNPSGSYPNSVVANLYVTESVPNPEESPQESQGGGLRIREIRNYESVDMLSNRKTFEYSNENDSTTGKLLLPLLLKEEKNLLSLYSDGNQGNAVEYDIFRFHAHQIGVSSLTSSVSRGVVGYSRVTSRIFDNEDNCLKTVVTDYRNEPAESVFGDFFYFRNWGNGKVLKQSVYESDGQILQSVTYNYEKKEPRLIKCNAYLEDRIVSNASLFTQGYQGTTFKRYVLTVYPYYRQWWTLKESVTTDFTERGIRSVRHSFTYNPYNHLVATDTLSQEAGSDKYVYKNLYAPDFSFYPLTTMCSSNYMINTLVQQNQEVVRNSETLLLKCKNIVFAPYSSQNVYGTFYLPFKEQYAINGNMLEDRIVYDYDNYLNMRYAVKDNADKVVYLWAYNNLYPVVEIRGASFSQVQSWLGADTIGALSANTTTVPAALELIRTALSDKPVLVTTYTYSPLYGITSQTSPNGTVTSYTYDGFGRLSSVLDHNGNVIRNHHYNYKQ